MSEISDRAFQQILFHYQDKPSTRLLVATKIVAGLIDRPDLNMSAEEAVARSFRVADMMIHFDFYGANPQSTKDEP